jgi:uncharacterized surface protein with fasciclin (FAS1) repeats
MNSNRNIIIAIVLVAIVALGYWMVSGSNQSAKDDAASMKTEEKKPMPPKETPPAPKVSEKTPAPSAEKSTPDAMMEKNTITDIAVANGNFKTLVTALQAAGLVETLSGPGPFTVFAPTDAAFAKLPAGTVEALLKDKKKLTSILTYHVVSGNVMAKDVVTLTSAKTLNGQSVTVNATKGVKINDALVITPDVVASNGVIHVIDTVLLPQ